MSRSTNALIALGFGYARYAVAILSGLVTFPLVLAHLDNETYSRWLMIMEVLAYLGFAELGIVALLTWLVAEYDGRGERKQLQQLVADVRACCTLSAVAYLAVFAGVWWLSPELIGLDGGLSSSLGMSVLLVAFSAIASFYGRLYFAVLNGVQDYWFLGVVSLLQSAVALAVTIGLLLADAGPIALAVGLALPNLISAAVSVWRVHQLGFDLLLGLPRPNWSGMLRLAIDSGAIWLAGIGGRLTIGSYAILIVWSGGSPADVICFTATSKLGEFLMQQSWMVVDSGLVGLAQLHGQEQRQRIRQLVLQMFRFMLISGGAVVIVLLAINPLFVRLWVGLDEFGGQPLNQAIAAMVFSLSVSHILSVSAAVLGQRRFVGPVNFACGLLFAGVALAAGKVWGTPGISWMNAAVSLLVSAPLCAVLLMRTTTLHFADLWQELGRLWLPRAIPFVLAAAVVGVTLERAHPIALGLLAGAIGVGYGLSMRSLCSHLPWPPRWRRWAERFRIIDAAAI